MWERALDSIESGNLDKVAREIDWVTKYQLIERYRAKHDLPLSSPRVAQLDLAYHDVHRSRGLYYLLQRNGAVAPAPPAPARRAPREDEGVARWRQSPQAWSARCAPRPTRR